MIRERVAAAVGDPLAAYFLEPGARGAPHLAFSSNPSLWHLLRCREGIYIDTDRRGVYTEADGCTQSPFGLTITETHP